MTVSSIQVWTTIVVSALAPLFFGSVDLFWVAGWTILLSASALCGFATPMRAEQRRILFGFFGVCGLYALVAIVQIIPNAIAPLNDPSWARVNELLGIHALPRISSRAEIPPLAIGHFLLFVTSFINGFLIGTSRHNSDRLMRYAQYSILLYVVYGLVALFVTPDMVLWAPKLAYRGNLTATFINHNTAATFVGTGAILWFCLALSTIQSMRFSSIRLLLLDRPNEALAFKIVARSVAALACFFALLLTGSRGGLIATCFGLLLATLLMMAKRENLKFWHVAIFASVGLTVTIMLLGQMGGIGSRGAFDEARWSVYELCVEAIRQRPLLGAGLGTFADIFPALRTGNFQSWGVWDFAHSTVLEIAVEMGIPITVLIVTIALGSLFILARAVIQSEGRTRRSLAAIAGISALGYLHSWIDFSLQIPGYFVVFAVLLGCGLARASSAEADGATMRA